MRLTSEQDQEFWIHAARYGDFYRRADIASRQAGEIVALWDRGWSDADIAKASSVSKKRVRQLIEWAEGIER